LDVIAETRAIEEISHVAHEYVNRAVELLGHLPNSPYRALLEQFAAFVLARRH
jgi:geranylgeranyl pyrophosphate synthase